MSNTTTQVAQPALVRLDWECEHFGLRVALLDTKEPSDEALAASLHLAREQGVQLLMWPAPEGRMVGSRLLDEFSGALVDRKVTYGRSLSPGLAVDPSHPVSVVPYAPRNISADLYELAVSSGAYSRFNVDRHFPKERFEAMYRCWIERSVAGELADTVLVVAANGDDAAGKGLAGMITLAESQGTGRIGLVAVASSHRGRGIATALMDAAHEWMLGRGAGEARVVTQMANAPACRLYERTGYQQIQVQHYFHFWPQIRVQRP